MKNVSIQIAEVCPVTFPVLADTVVDDCITDLELDIVVEDIVARTGPLDDDGTDELIELPLLSKGDVTELLALLESNGSERT